MATEDLTKTYEPNAALAYLYRRFFDHIHVDDAWVNRVRQAASRGSVVYVMRSVSFIDFLALDHLTKRFNLPQIRFAQDMGLWLAEPLGPGLLRALLPRKKVPMRERLEHALATGGSAALFLKGPPQLLEQTLKGARRGKSEGDEPLRALFALQRKRERPILLVPQTFVWTKRPDKRDVDLVDTLFGPREWPGRVRSTVHFLANYRHVDFRAGDEVDLSTFLRDGASSDPSGAPSDPDEALVRRVTYALLRRLERERRAVLGPAKKPADRVRDEIVRSARLQGTIRELAGGGRREQLLLTARAYAMLRELEATPELDVHRLYRMVLDVVVHRIYAGIEIDEAGIEHVREAATKGTVIFLPSHKSHVDYLLLSYVLEKAHIQLPLIAAGDNLAFFPMGPIFRRGGAFFIRRSFRGDRLYAAVVDAYLRRVVRDGYAIEFFLEGGRSRTGKLLPPKFGLLSMVVDAVLSAPDRHVTFVPVSIGYDRIVEERSYLRELRGGEKRKEDARALLRGTRVLGGFYGRVNVQFGEPLSLDRVQAEMNYREIVTPGQRRSLVLRLGYRAMAEINRVTSVTPGAVVATALLVATDRRRGVPHLALVEACRRIVATLGRRGARMARSLVTTAGTLRPDAVREAAQLFARGELVEVHVPGAGLEGEQRARAAIYTGDDVVYTMPDEKRLVVSLSKNIIIHFFVDHALIATALLSRPTGPADPAALRERVRLLSRLFKNEFLFRADASFDQIFDETLASVVAEGELVRSGNAFVTGPGHDGLDGRGWLEFYAAVLAPYLEGYQVVARAATALLKGPLSAKDVVKRALAVGERMFLAGEITRRESLSRPILENGLLALQDLQYVHASEGKFQLAPSFASAETAPAIEARIRSLIVDAPDGPASEP